MRLRATPEDFVVEEEIHLAAGKTGPYSVYRVEKRGVTTQQVQESIAASLHIGKRLISFPGLKEKASVATQYASVARTAVVLIEGVGFRARRVGSAARALQPSDLRGNRFTVVVRDLSLTEAQRLAPRVRQIAEFGLPNYFDAQRFGSFSTHGGFIGKRIMQRDAEGALKIYLGDKMVGDPDHVRVFKEFAKSHWGEWETLLAQAPAPSNFRSVLTYLKDHPAAYRKALNLIPHALLSLYQSAYQSWLWNLIAGMFIRSTVSTLGFALFNIRIAGCDLPVYYNLPEGMLSRLAPLKVSMPNHRAAYGDPLLEQVVAKVLANEGLALGDFKARILKRAFADKSARALLAFPQDASGGDPENDELSRRRWKVALKFFLPPGCYATLLLKAALPIDRHEPTDDASAGEERPVAAERVEGGHMQNTGIRLADLQSQACIVYQADIHPIAIFYAGGRLYAVDNRCPHMGFPLAQGTVKDGILTCHWHHARFELATGGTFDLFADDVRSFPVESREGEVWIDLSPLAPDVQKARLRRRILHGLERNLNLVTAKAVIATLKDETDVDSPGTKTLLSRAQEAFALGLDFGARNRQQGWAMGQTIHVAMMNLVPFLEREDAMRALYHGLSAVARDCDGAPPRRSMEPLPGSAVDIATLKRWFRRFVEVRDEEGADRCIVTSVQQGAPPAQITDLLFSAATDHRFIQVGHTADFSNKAIEAWETARQDLTAPATRPADELASLAPSFAEASRAEESNAWRHPIDLVELLESTFEQLAPVLEAGRGRRGSLTVRPAGEIDSLTATLLSDKPHDIISAMVDALRNGMAIDRLAGAVCYAAALRMARFHTSNEFGDWDTVLHTFTFANAIHQAIRRAPSLDILRGVFDAAMSVYLDRFLNMPAARIPQAEKTKDRPDDLLVELLSLFDRQQQVNEAAATCSQYLANGGNPARLMATIGKALLREDPDFHTIQTVEASFAQYRLWTGTPQAEHFLIAAARYLAAHAPTARAMEQTFRIAWRLHRGDRLFEE